jgi:hypothetical protein
LHTSQEKKGKEEILLGKKNTIFEIENQDLRKNKKTNRKY